MKRRDFLKLSPALTLPFLLNGLPVTAAARNPLLKLLGEQSIQNGRILVLIQLTGGNDGLNTLIPLDQYSNLVKARSNIVIPDNKVLSINGMPQTGLHPAMTGIQNLYNNGMVNIVQDASYPNPSFSHFRATDIMFTASDANVYMNTGWMGRTLESEYPGYPDNYPNQDMPDPLAIEIGSQSSLVTQCTAINPTVTVTNPDSFYELINGVAGTVPDSPYGHELTFLRLIKQQTNNYTTIIKNAFNATAANTVAYPSDNALADQLKIVSRLIKGGLKTPVYIVNHPGTFDTHANQVDISDTTKGTHANLLSVLSTAVSAFQQDLINMQVSDRVVTMTVTEFGRRIKSNDSLGSDHGTATPIFFFGSNLNPITIGSNPVIPDNATTYDQVPMQNDFRSVYYTVLKEWFMLTDDQLNHVFPTPYTILPIFKQLAALPLTLLSFTGKWLTQKVNLQWVVDHESDIDYYEVQRSDNGINFEKIGIMTAANTAVQHTYNYDDLSLSKSLYYYRIKIVEQSGKVSFSQVLLLKANDASNGIAIKIFPNPVTNWFTVSLTDKISGPVTVCISDLAGKEIWKQEKDVTDAYNINFSFADKKPATGVHVVRVLSKNQEATMKIMVE